MIRAAKASGEVRTECTRDPVLLTADDGIVGMDLRPGAMNKGALIADGKPLVGTLHFSKDDLLDWLDRNGPRQKRPRTQPLQDCARAAISDLWSEGLPNAAALPNKPLCDQVRGWLAENMPDVPRISDDVIERAAGRRK